jgi:hypothetical protein
MKSIVIKVSIVIIALVISLYADSFSITSFVVGALAGVGVSLVDNYIK